MTRYCSLNEVADRRLVADTTPVRERRPIQSTIDFYRSAAGDGDAPG